MSLDLHKLTHLIAVAEEGTLTRAAARLHLSQQALSTSIRVLEREVGVPLLDRSGTTIALLPAGEALVDDARVLLGMARAALARARRTGRGERETLRIGHTPAITGEEVIALLNPVAAAHPDLGTEVHQRYPDELTASLLAGDLDIGLCRAMPPAHGLTRTELGRQRLHIAVAAGHRRTAHDTVRLADLAEESFVVWGTPGRSSYTDLLIGYCREAGFEPHIERNPLQGTPPVTAVIGTERLAFVTAPPGPTAGGRAHVLRLEPPLYAPVIALYADHIPSESREAFLTTATPNPPA